MYETLKSIWYGDLSPHDSYVKIDSEYKHLMKLKNNLVARLLTTLSDEGRECFEKIEDLNNEMQTLSEEESFITGFQLGARIIIEVTSEHRGEFST